MPTKSPQPPVHASLTELTRDPKTGQLVDSRRVSRDWVQWFFQLLDRLDKTSQVVGSANVPPQSGAIPDVQLPLPPFGGGRYRISYYLRVTTPASVSSSVGMRLSWIEGGLARIFTGPLLASNNTAAMDAQSLVINVDRNSPVSYGTTYASNAANQMKYALDVTVEVVVEA